MNKTAHVFPTNDQLANAYLAQAEEQLAEIARLQTAADIFVSLVKGALLRQRYCPTCKRAEPVDGSGPFVRLIV